MIMKGQKINDRYQIIKSIGEGGMANVYLAYDTILDRNVAVKVLRGDLASDEKFVRRFQREALSASSLNHPNIVEVYDVGEDNGNYYIVMEYIEGKHLKQLLKKRGKLTLSEVVDIMSQVCEGMAVAHDSFIIHRDIKPQNIMILDSGLVKITDFGIAMALNSTQLTQTNTVMGSVHYLPPEQASGKGATMQSDIYSMGILMYELLTGEVPFKGDNAVEIALKQLKEPLPDIRKKLPDVPNSIVNILKRACAKNPKNRYADAREMLADIKTALDPSRKDEPIIEYKYPEFDETLKSAKKNVQKAVPKSEEAKDEMKAKAKDDDADDEDIDVKPADEQEIKKENKLLLVLGVIFTSIVIVVTAIIVLLPNITNVASTKVPDVSNMEELKAEKKLQDEGLRIKTDLEKIDSDEIEEGKVVKTDPAAGRTVKKGTEVTIYVSTGPSTLTLEDYVGRDYTNVQDKLENDYKINVIIEKREIDGTESYNKNQILEQSPKAGEKVKAGDTVTFYVPNMDVYPDFTKENYTLDQVQDFAKKNNLTLKVTYSKTSTADPGTIIYQSRKAGSTVSRGGTLEVTVSQESEYNANNNSNKNSSQDDAQEAGDE